MLSQSDREKIGDRTTEKELSAGAVRRSEGGVKVIHQKAAVGGDAPTNTRSRSD